ncbi:MAG: hypothetical protein LBT20_04240 [Clostridiales bacterium]|jgi:hypothetical protein|nr:hypothetical protein [Clostridiales bacterium]
MIRRVDGGVTIKFPSDFADIKKCADFINKNRIDIIYLSREVNVERSDPRYEGDISLRFFEMIDDPTHVKELMIGTNCVDYDTLYIFSALEKLVCTLPVGVTLDLSNFPMLKDLSTDNLSAYKNLDDIMIQALSLYEKKPDFDLISRLTSLENLNLEGTKGFRFSDIRTLYNLKQFGGFMLDIQNLNDIEDLKNLEHLCLFFCRKLENIERLSELKCLKTLSVAKCSKIIDVSAIGKCQRLEKLSLDCVKNSDLTKLSTATGLELLMLSACGNATDLKFIQHMLKLEFFSFVDTNILDGDLTPCLRLKYVGTLDKKHYNIKSIDLPHERTRFKQVNTNKFEAHEIDLSGEL